MGEELEVWVNNILDWEDEDNVEWLSSIEGDEPLARKMVSFIWRESIMNKYIDNLRILVYRWFVSFITVLSGERLIVV